MVDIIKPLTIPNLSLVVLIGASGSGKSSFARKHFGPYEVLSSDFCRGLVADDENDQSATSDAFDVLHYVAAKRLAAGRLTVVDATNVQPEARKPLVELARRFHVLPVAIVLNVPERVCVERNQSRPERQFPARVVARHVRDLRRSLRGLQREGFRYVYVLNSVEEVAAAVIERQPLWIDRRHEHGPFDIIGDVHGCIDELLALLAELGYSIDGSPGSTVVTPPAGRTAVFLGDLVDRGPDSPAVLQLVMDMVAAGTAHCLPGNHDTKLLRKLNGRDVRITHGLAETLEQLDGQPQEFIERVRRFLDGLVSHYVFDDGQLVVAHAGMKAELQGRGSRAVREFALYGETTGETDEFGLPVRYPWANEYRGRAMVVYGHTPVPEADWLNRTINIDTGCVFGGRLAALRYPELELRSVPAARTYAEPARPFLPAEQVAPTLTSQQQHDEVLDLADVLGRRNIQTRLMGNVVIGEANATAALEVISRFAVDPKWLIYLPPTMSPSETSRQDGLLEYPAEAFAYFRAQGVPAVVCEEKHMGSRAIVVLCRDEEAGRRRFGVLEGGSGVVYTRTGRPFFDDPALQQQLLERLHAAFDSTGFWDEFNTTWALLDCELMPWSAKAQELLQRQYAAVGAAARASLAASLDVLRSAKENNLAVEELLTTFSRHAGAAQQYVAAYRHYCWPVNSLDDLTLAPFHLLATEGAVHIDRDHRWHMETLAGVCRADERLLLATNWTLVDTTDPLSEAAAIARWTELTERGGEGMVLKPLNFVARGTRGLVQPAVKTRGREYLRIIYGPDYDAPENLERLRSRGLSRKRQLALREFALGIEGLERFVRREPLRRVHECVFGVLALESEPVDPRL